MSNIHLSEVEGLSSPTPVIDANSELIDRELFTLKGTFVAGVETTLQSGPTTGSHLLDETFRDANGALWACTSAGSPGTWKQVTPAVVDANPTGTIPDGYWIARRDQGFRHYTYNLAGTAWLERHLSGSATLNYGSIASGAEATLTITVTGAVTTNTPAVVLGWSAALEDGIVVKQAWVSAADTVSVRVRNVTGGSIDPASLTCRAAVIPQ